jgi:hypothetical protein
VLHQSHTLRPDSHDAEDCTIDEWQFFQRESLHQLYGLALEQLVQAHQSIGAYGDAIGYARRWRPPSDRCGGTSPFLMASSL